MNVTLSLEPEVEKGLMARAQTRGVSLDDYVQELVAREVGLPVGEEPPLQVRISIWSDVRIIRDQLSFELE
jgi:hypothetical protein